MYVYVSQTKTEMINQMQKKKSFCDNNYNRNRRSIPSNFCPGKILKPSEISSYLMLEAGVLQRL